MELARSRIAIKEGIMSNKKYWRQLKKLVNEYNGEWLGQQSKKIKYRNSNGILFSAPVTPSNTYYPIKDAIANLKDDGHRMWEKLLKICRKNILTFVMKTGMIIR
jgi:hypothetical protein